MQAEAPISKVENSWFTSRIAILAGVFIALNFLAGKFYFIVSGGIYPTVHTVMEFASIIWPCRFP